ncbi:MAG: hypothetical protein HYU97_04640 [Deltaproteobacteria bacterium]|nr:hypothetical protein [Deltaproteobacteria bacterium]
MGKARQKLILFLLGFFLSQGMVQVLHAHALGAGKLAGTCDTCILLQPTSFAEAHDPSLNIGSYQTDFLFIYSNPLPLGFFCDLQFSRAPPILK